MKKSVFCCSILTITFNLMQGADVTADDMTKGFISAGTDILIYGGLLLVFSLIVSAVKGKDKNDEKK